MKIFIYKCLDCDGEFDVKERIMDTPASECPECGGRGLYRTIGMTHIITKRPSNSSRPPHHPINPRIPR